MKGKKKEVQNKNKVQKKGTSHKTRIKSGKETSRRETKMYLEKMCQEKNNIRGHIKRHCSDKEIRFGYYVPCTLKTRQKNIEKITE